MELCPSHATGLGTRRDGCVQRPPLALKPPPNTVTLVDANEEASTHLHRNLISINRKSKFAQRNCTSGSAAETNVQENTQVAFRFNKESDWVLKKPMAVSPTRPSLFTFQMFYTEDKQKDVCTFRPPEAEEENIQTHQLSSHDGVSPGRRLQNFTAKLPDDLKRNNA